LNTTAIPGEESSTMTSQSGYNAITQNGFAANEADVEGASLLRKPNQDNGTGSSVVTRLHKHFTADISKSWADIALLGCYIITGLLDSSSVFIWGSFVSMQTGTIRKATMYPICLLMYLQETQYILVLESLHQTTMTDGCDLESQLLSSAWAVCSSAITTAHSRHENAGYWSHRT